MRIMEMKDELQDDRRRPPAGQKWANEGVICAALVDLAVLGQIKPSEVTLFETTKEIKVDTLSKLENYVAENVQGRINSLAKYNQALERCLTALEMGHSGLVNYQLRGETDEGVEFERTLEEVKTDFVKYYWVNVNNLKSAIRPIFANMRQEMVDIMSENSALSHANTQLQQFVPSVPWYKRIFRRKTKP